MRYPGDDDDDEVGQYIKKFFNAISSFPGLSTPASAILSLYENAEGPVSATNNANKTKFTLTTRPSSGDYGYGNTPPLPVIWQLATSSIGTFKYTVTSDVRFVCTKIKQIYYVNAYTASKSLNLHVTR